MTQLDNDIRAALSAEERQLFDELDSDVSLNRMMLAPFRTRMRWWSAYAFILAAVFAGLTIWCGYEFFTAGTLDDRVFWGFSMLTAWFSTAMLKMWFFMEMNKLALVREIRRIELQLASRRS